MKFMVGLYCGAKWYRWYDWKDYGFFKKHRESWFFNIGPFIFWDGS